MGTSTINGRGCNPLKESSRISAINIAITLTGATAFDAHAQHRLPQAKTLAAVSHGAHVRRVKAGSLIANDPMIGDVTGRCAIWNPTLTCSNVIPRCAAIAFIAPGRYTAWFGNFSTVHQHWVIALKNMPLYHAYP